MTYFYAEVADTYGGEANYSWVRRYKIKAKTTLGAIRKVPSPGNGWRLFANYGDMASYDAVGACARCFVEVFDEAVHGMHRVEEL